VLVVFVVKVVLEEVLVVVVVKMVLEEVLVVVVVELVLEEVQAVASPVQFVVILPVFVVLLWVV
jgi:hypothetical protein